MALSLSPMIASKILKPHTGRRTDVLALLPNLVDRAFNGIKWLYGHVFDIIVRFPVIMIAGLLGAFAAIWLLYQTLGQEYAPTEERGSFCITVRGPEGASFEYMSKYLDEIERRLLPYTESG